VPHRTGRARQEIGMDRFDSWKDRLDRTQLCHKDYLGQDRDTWIVPLRTGRTGQETGMDCPKRTGWTGQETGMDCPKRKRTADSHPPGMLQKRQDSLINLNGNG
jgi:hypothetical protein